ncbi:MAG: InlB B-repeat-containing protein, partial [Candidatus Riflebacteria bacterium]|nr:InlB B-repeat-containing protein [Candidatus Riflebacteria bacterium]
MLKRIIFFFISATILVALYGCHAGGNSPLAPNNAETVVSPEIRIVNDKGRFDDITFPSGAVIKCPNENTFKEGVRVTAAEQKVPVITDNSGKFSYIYVYNISAVMPSENSLTADVPVNTIEKPLKVSFPNNSTTGICYIGTRESESDPWRYTLADDGGVGNLRYSRLSVRSPKVCYFDIYRLNIQFRLFVFDNEDSDKAEVDFVDVSTGSKDNKISIENGKYTEDLEIKISLYGEKLDSINVDNLTARIIYRSKSLSPVQLKANGSIVKQNDSDDKAVTGGYEHSFEINNIKIDSSMSGEAVLSFVLNLNGISLEDFPTDFLVEFYSDTKVEKAIPFIYSQAFSFETKENQEEPEPGPGPEPGPEPGPLVTYSIAYDLDGGEPTGDNPTSYTAENEITLSNPKKEGYTFTGWTGTDLDNPTTKVTIAKGSTGDRSYKANWQQNAPDEYTLTLVAGTGIASVDDSKAYKADESIELNYTLKDGYEFDKWYDSDDNAVTSPFTMPAKAVTLTANAKPILYNITYTDIENCTFTADNPTTYTVETADFELPKPAKDYYSFVGWVLNGGEPVETVTITKGTHENRTYKAKFTPATYTITLDPNDGTVEYTTKEYNVETADFTLPKAAKDYYSFDGWVLNGDETVETVTITK